MILPPSTPHPELDALIEQAKARPPMTPAELQAQRISFAFGMLPEGSIVSREDVAAMDYAKYGNLAAMDARLAAAEAMAEAAERFRLFLSDHPSPAVTYLVTSVGNDAWADFCAALAKWRAGK